MLRSRRTTQSGLSAVEMVITLPFILILLVGVIEIGFGLVQYMKLTKLVQNGARYAVTSITGTGAPDLTSDEVIQAIQCVVVTGSTQNLSSGCDGVEDKPIKNLLCSDIAVEEEANTGNTVHYVRVTANYHHVLLTALGEEFFAEPDDEGQSSGGITFRASALMRIPQ